MKSHSRIRLLILIWLIVALPFCLAFFHYYALSIADFLSSSHKIETSDDLDVPPGLLDNKWKTAASTTSGILFSPEPSTILRFHTALPQLTSRYALTSVLRC